MFVGVAVLLTIAVPAGGLCADGERAAAGSQAAGAKPAAQDRSTRADRPVVTVETLEGERFEGSFVSLDAKQLVLRPAAGPERTVPVGSLLEVRVAGASAQPEPAGKGTVQLYLIDGSVLACDRFRIQGRDVVARSVSGDALHFDRQFLHSVLLAETVNGVADAWEKLRRGQHESDVLVLRKPGNLLDTIEGVVGDITDEHIQFLLDDSEVPVKRERVFGIVFVRRARPQTRPAVCTIELLDGQQWNAHAVATENDSLRVTLSIGPQLNVPVSRIRSIDFSLGKVAYLSRMDPVEATFEPFFSGDTISAELFQYRRDRNFQNEPLVLDDHEYLRGLCIHSKTRLRYRLNGVYRRFKAIAGIDPTLPNPQLGHVVLTIRGDGKTLFSGAIAGNDAPRALDLSVEGVRELEILVDFGENMSICDHLILADARLIR